MSHSVYESVIPRYESYFMSHLYHLSYTYGLAGTSWRGPLAPSGQKTNSPPCVLSCLFPLRVWGKFWNGVLESWKVQWRLSLASRIHLWNQVFDPSYGSKVTNYSQMSYLDTSIWPNCVFSRYFKLCRNRIRHLVRMIITFKLHYTM